MIPDKIYLPVVEEEGKRLLSTIWWPEDNRPSNEKFVLDAIPYIRKDVILTILKDAKHLAEAASKIDSI